MQQKKYYIVSLRPGYHVVNGKLVPSGTTEKCYKKKGFGWYGESDKDLAFKYNYSTAKRIVSELNDRTKIFYGSLERSRYELEEVEE